MDGIVCVCVFWARVPEGTAKIYNGAKNVDFMHAPSTMLVSSVPTHVPLPKKFSAFIICNSVEPVCSGELARKAIRWRDEHQKDRAATWVMRTSMLTTTTLFILVWIISVCCVTSFSCKKYSSVFCSLFFRVGPSVRLEFGSWSYLLFLLYELAAKWNKII